MIESHHPIYRRSSSPCSSIPCYLNLVDIRYLDGVSLIDEDLYTRRARLEEIRRASITRQGMLGSRGLFGCGLIRRLRMAILLSGWSVSLEGEWGNSPHVWVDCVGCFLEGYFCDFLPATSSGAS
uniref:Uncharacterized protein n=1 Tax=Candidatus Methanogaster sp. ANME-2c ERB4 TaxID=2759911 RepID=A0A7G9Y1J1_9EURY|nr:hypothetical protein ELGCOBFC_00005 [Methanosarcinales archaeon ANME-2c ERB4]